MSSRRATRPLNHRATSQSLRIFVDPASTTPLVQHLLLLVTRVPSAYLFPLFCYPPSIYSFQRGITTLAQLTHAAFVENLIRTRGVLTVEIQTWVPTLTEPQAPKLESQQALESKAPGAASSWRRESDWAQKEKPTTWQENSFLLLKPVRHTRPSRSPVFFSWNYYYFLLTIDIFNMIYFDYGFPSPTPPIPSLLSHPPKHTPFLYLTRIQMSISSSIIIIVPLIN